MSALPKFGQKPRLRQLPDGTWACYFNYRLSTGLYLGRTTGIGDTPEAAFADFQLLDNPPAELPRKVRFA